MRHLLLYFLLLFTLEARENPFFPAKREKNIPITSNENFQIDPLKSATIILPSTARVIEGVTLKYKTLDGAQHEKQIELRNSIDWRLPIFISQHYSASDRENSKEKEYVFQEIATLRFIRFEESEKILKITTNDKMLRNFILVKPHRVVCDFQRETEFGSFFKKAPKGSRFTKLRIGTHKKYYRVVIELDGYYSYKIKKTQKGYKITLE